MFSTALTVVQLLSFSKFTQHDDLRWLTCVQVVKNDLNQGIGPQYASIKSM